MKLLDEKTMNIASQRANDYQFFDKVLKSKTKSGMINRKATDIFDEIEKRRNAKSSNRRMSLNLPNIKVRKVVKTLIDIAGN